MALSVHDGELIVTVAMTCPLDSRDLQGSGKKLRRAMVSRDPASLEACTDLLITPGQSNTVALQCGSFSTLDGADKLVSGLKVRLPEGIWWQAMATSERMLGAALASLT